MQCVKRYLGDHWLSTLIDPYADPWYRFARILDAIDSACPVASGSSWLDLGCHQGQFICLVQAKYGVVGSGIDDWPVTLKSDDSWRYFQQDLANGMALEQRFQFVSALEVIEHIIDTDAFLQACNGVLEHNGYLVLSTPNINSLRNRVRVPFGAYPAGIEYRNVIHHVRLYNVAALKRQLLHHGFAVSQVRGVNVAPMRVIRWGLANRFFERAADLLPNMCGDIIMIAQKVHEGERSSDD